ncbi:hypothetical protein [Sphaerotilus sp.]|uniref:hypothetical protein n=1 Tax=Sphaerotilus sp. TaxID=2093942 RepID=UPI0034E1C80B
MTLPPQCRLLHRWLGALALTVTSALSVQAGELPADLAAKAAAATRQLVQWAADPVVITAVREANSHDAGGMNNGKWTDVSATDPIAKSITHSKVGMLIAKWEHADSTLNKLVLRDQKGNAVGASLKPLLFNNANRPQFVHAIKGQPWIATEVKPDPLTQIPSVQVGVPVLDGGTPIGVLHAGVSTK